jgi:hypothetical protein
MVTVARVRAVKDRRAANRAVALSDGQRHLACWLTLQYLWGHEC